MIIRQLSQEQYERLHKDMIQKAYTAPLEACYSVHMKIGNASYVVKIQPERRQRMAVLQAYRIFCNEHGQDFKLITKGSLLSAFLDILIYQGVE